MKLKQLENKTQNILKKIDDLSIIQRFYLRSTKYSSFIKGMLLTLKINKLKRKKHKLFKMIANRKYGKLKWQKNKRKHIIYY